MINKKRILALFLLAISAAFAYPVYAQYTPLVRLPGLPGTGAISLSMYLVGLYNFLVSIVGIVAVMMMIVGGIRYITSAGSSTAISDAKDIVTSAVYGLVLAIFAWLIVAAINPDVLYIKQPGTGFNRLSYLSCAKNYSPAACTCNDGFVAGAFATPDACNNACRTGNHCLINSDICVRGGVNDTMSPRFQLNPNNGKCLCIDGADIVPGAPTTCQAACAVNNCYVADFRIGFMTVDDWDTLNTYPSDYDRAKAYAINYTTYEKPLEADIKDVLVCDMTLAINAVDYTISPPGAPAPTYSFDVTLNVGVPTCTNVPPNADDIITGTYPAPLAGGYFGSMACNIPPYECLNDESECKFEGWSNSIECPMRIKVDWGGGNVKYATQYIRWFAPDNAPPPAPPVCNNNGIKDNGETGIDCGGGGCAACAAPPPPPPPPPPPAEVCNDNVDNDGDTLIDCADAADCPNGSGCAGGGTCAGGVCAPAFVCGVDTVSDADGNVYNTVQIGAQCWMKQDLRTGIMIPTLTDPANNGIIEKYCLNDNPADCAANGAYYNWDEAMGYVITNGAQGICPAGWHIPTDGEWFTLELSLTIPGNTCDPARFGSDCVDAGTKLSNGGVTGFDAFMRGFRQGQPGWGYGSFIGVGVIAGYYTSTEVPGFPASMFDRDITGWGVGRWGDSKQYSMYIRCIK